MTENQTYNGWENKPTWLIPLWIDNDQSSSEYWRNVCIAAINDYSELGIDDIDDIILIDEDEKRNAKYRIILELKAEFETHMQDILTTANVAGTFWDDLLGWGLAVVNWDEIADHFYDNAIEEMKNDL